MKLFIYLSLIIASVASVSAQSVIRGQVLDEKNSPVPGANIYFEGSFEGTTSDTLGRFDMHTSLEGKQVLIISFIGYQLYRKNSSFLRRYQRSMQYCWGMHRTWEKW